MSTPGKTDRDTADEERIARAFSSHDFEAAYPFLAEDIVWDLVGEAPLSGKAAVVDACARSTAELESVTTSFRSFRVVVGRDAAVVDSVADYTDSDGATTTVASCDLYDFTGGRVTAIKSYNIELPAAGEPDRRLSNGI